MTTRASVLPCRRRLTAKINEEFQTPTVVAAIVVARRTSLFVSRYGEFIGLFVKGDIAEPTSHLSGLGLNDSSGPGPSQVDLWRPHKFTEWPTK